MHYLQLWIQCAFFISHLHRNNCLLIYNCDRGVGVVNLYSKILEYSHTWVLGCNDV